MSNRVVVIFQNPEYGTEDLPFPPVGTKGTVIGSLDKYGDYEVMFDDYPCPVGLEESWETHKSMIVFIEDPKVINDGVESTELVESLI
ncbi:hypothetical protein [Moritella sp. F3]|uniref:hypothetical protein n=1 Tax=Moritella sp. F3 TaxID=2718882 RepID=UPI0018E1B8DE|nr:hypothetical protein [Moritella sp. F3]GIC77661.1 hypothetical protein FMO001_23880 [Moritella sp. F1]GIC82074.1 hypothetical protein FMO003_23550 [Moritella sp. F3]